MGGFTRVAGYECDDERPGKGADVSLRMQSRRIKWEVCRPSETKLVLVLAAQRAFFSHIF
jgi:hypothetical protein